MRITHIDAVIGPSWRVRTKAPVTAIRCSHGLGSPLGKTLTVGAQLAGAAQMLHGPEAPEHIQTLCHPGVRVIARRPTYSGFAGVIHAEIRVADGLRPGVASSRPSAVQAVQVGGCPVVETTIYGNCEKKV